MANKTVRLFSIDLIGETGLTLELISTTDGSVGNGAGDTLTEVSNGLFETTVTEAITGWWKVQVKQSGIVQLGGGDLYIASDAIGEYLVDDFARNTSVANWSAMTVDHTSTGSFGAAIGALSAATGAGARTVTITVNDGAAVLQNARVRLTNGAETYTGLTNVSGVVVFNVDDNDWIVSITKAGYSYSGTTLTVNGTETATYSMTLISLTASDVDKVTGYWTVLDEEGNEASGIVVTVKARQASRGSAGALHDAATRTATSAANGLVQFTNMIPGWRYSVVANDEYVADFTVPADAVTSVELGSIVARLT